MMSKLTHQDLSVIAAAMLLLGLAGCSSPQKSPKPVATPSTSTAANTDTLSASSKKLEQDFSQTESDFTKLETFGPAKK